MSRSPKRNMKVDTDTRTGKSAQLWVDFFIHCTREKLPGVAQHLQVWAVEGRQRPCLHIRQDLCLNAPQPVAHGVGSRQGSSSIVGEDAARLRRLTWRQVVVVSAAGQFRARLRLQDQPRNMGRHTAGEQIGVSQIREQREAYTHRQG
jgi:hypothetical protein